MSEGLKPCPFCGKKASIQDCSYFGSTPMWSAMCDNPKCFAYTEAFKTKKEAVECWNSRPAEEALQKRIAELETERDRMREALEHVVKLLDRPMLKVDMCLYMDSAIKVAREALKGAE